MKIEEPKKIIEIKYDRGTIVFSGLRRGKKDEEYSGIYWDHRVNKWRALGYHYHRLKRLLEQKKYCISDLTKATQTITPLFSTIKLRPYQKAAYLAWRLNNYRGIISLPTGSGKTMVAIYALSQLKKSAFCIVPTKALMEQWHRSIKRFYRGKVGILGDGKRDIQPITISTFESAYRHASWLGNQFEILIIDEAHHFGSGKRDEILKMFISSIRMGLTATPQKDDDNNIIEHLIGKKVYEQKIHDLIGSYLADYNYHCHFLPLTKEERRKYDREEMVFKSFFKAYIKSFPEASWQDFLKTASRTIKGQRAIAAYNRTRKIIAFTHYKKKTIKDILVRHNQQKILIFTSNVETALIVSKTYLVMPIVSEISRQEREWALNMFKLGRIKTLVACRVLNEGIDIPSAEIAIIIGGNAGTVEHLQRIGRLLRPLGSKKAIIYELITENSCEERLSYKRRKEFDPKRFTSH